MMVSAAMLIMFAIALGVGVGALVRFYQLEILGLKHEIDSLERQNDRLLSQSVYEAAVLATYERDKERIEHLKNSLNDLIRSKITPVMAENTALKQTISQLKSWVETRIKIFKKPIYSGDRVYHFIYYRVYKKIEKLEEKCKSETEKWEEKWKSEDK